MMKTTDGHRWAPIFLVGILALVSNAIAEGPAVTILQSPEAPALEKYAGEEMTRILETLFDARVSVKSEAGDGESVIRVGSMKTHPPSGAALQNLGAQEHLLKSLRREGQNILFVAGGSPVATLWAVYEFGHHFGMRYTVQGDFVPIEKPKFTITGFNKVFEPNITVRAWRTFEPGLAGQESWGIEDHRKLFGQLAKLKFNRIVLVDHPESWRPTRGLPVTGDTAGRSVFEGAKVFENPNLVEAETDEARVAASGKLKHEILSAATKLGFDVVNVPSDETAPGLELLSLAQPKGGVLPQFHTARLPEKLGEIRGDKKEGFSVQCWIPGNLNPDVYYLSRASFDAKITPRQALDDLVTPICGEGVAERLANGFAAIEEVSALIEKEDPDFAVPDPKMFLEHFESTEEAPEWWAKASELYGTAVNEMYRGNTRARGGARPFILYHAKYFTFALHYMTAVQAARDASRAKHAEDTEAYVEHLETAVEAMHNALQIYADVARDNSDRGVIAVLNEYAYRPLLKALDEAPLP